jgi:eukaryotic-like serine/threonine-protein kinase
VSGATAGRPLFLPEATLREMKIQISDTPGQELKAASSSPANEPTRSQPSLPNVAMVAGRRPQIATETQSVLRIRLRAALIVLLAACGSFLIRDLFIPDFPLLWLQVLVCAILAGGVALMYSGPGMSLRQLRGIELFAFATTAAYLAVYQYTMVLQKVQQGSSAYAMAAGKNAIIFTFGLMILYGTFIPNTWRRAACVVFPLAAIPPLVGLVLRLRFGSVYDLGTQLGTFEQVSDNLIILTLGAVAATYGAHIINSLRVEAFKARQFGQYRLKEQIGAGGMGEVYLAEHCLLKRPCAIKLIRPGKQADPEAIARFEREVRTTAKLSHWNTVQIFDYGRTDDGTFYYVMEYLPGMCLADIVRQYGPLPPGRVIHLLRQTCQALREAHDNGLIHRDIKPANIFAAVIGGVCDVVKLLDFGLVKQTVPDHDVQLSQDGTATGSPLYMSPEQATAAADPDARSDIYSLGATAYVLLTGHVPFDGRNPVQVMIAHARDPVVPPSKRRPGLPADLDEIVLRCLAKSPDERFPDILSLDRALAACADAGTWTETDASRWWSEISRNGEGMRHLAGQVRQVSAELEETIISVTR